MPRRSHCGVPDCIDPIDREFGDGFCTDHSQEWRRSRFFDAAIADESVRFAARLRIPSLLSRALRPHKKAWVKSLNEETE